jgi:hypothetical protein
MHRFGEHSIERQTDEQLGLDEWIFEGNNRSGANICKYQQAKHILFNKLLLYTDNQSIRLASRFKAESHTHNKTTQQDNNPFTL